MLLDVQNDILDIFGSRVVVPLVPGSKFTMLIARLNPEFHVDNRSYIMLTQQIATVATSALGAPVASLKQHQHEITTALNMLFQGF